MLMMLILSVMMVVVQLPAEQVWFRLAASIWVELCLPHREETCTFQQNRHDNEDNEDDDDADDNGDGDDDDDGDDDGNDDGNDYDNYDGDRNGDLCSPYHKETCTFQLNR